MPIFPKGWLALLISVAVHGIAFGLFCWLASRNQAQKTQVDLPQFVRSQDEPSMTAFVMGDRTGVMDLSPKPNPVSPGKSESPSGQKSAPKPGSLAESITGQASPIAEPGPATGVKGSSNTGGGNMATTTFFAVPARGQKIVYLIDRSASMGPNGALEVAGQELLASLNRLPKGTNFQVIVYNRSANLLMPRYPDWLLAQQDVIKNVAAAVNVLPPEGGTDHIRALKFALSLHPDVVFFLTDAGDVQTDLLREITKFNQGRTAIHVIELIAGQGTRDAGPLQQLAHENRGTFQSVLVH